MRESGPDIDFIADQLLLVVRHVGALPDTADPGQACQD